MVTPPPTGPGRGQYFQKVLEPTHRVKPLQHSGLPTPPAWLFPQQAGCQFCSEKNPSGSVFLLSRRMVEPQAAPTPRWLLCPGLTSPPADPDMHSPSGSLTAAHHSLLGRALVFPCRPRSAGVGSYPSRAQSPNQMILGLDTDLALWLLLCIC